MRSPHPLPGSVEIKDLALDIKGIRGPFRFAELRVRVSAAVSRSAVASLTPAKRLDLALDIKGIRGAGRRRRSSVVGDERLTTEDTKAHGEDTEANRDRSSPPPPCLDMSKQRS